MHQLPEGLSPLARSAARITSPLFRCLEREVASANQLLHTVRADLEACLHVCEGKEKSSNRVRSFLSDFAHGACAHVACTV